MKVSSLQAGSAHSLSQSSPGKEHTHRRPSSTRWSYKRTLREVGVGQMEGVGRERGHHYCSFLLLHINWYSCFHVESTSVVSDTCLCLVQVRGVYPTLTVMDIQGEGTATPYSKAHLWSMLSIDR